MAGGDLTLCLTEVTDSAGRWNREPLDYTKDRTHNISISLYNTKGMIGVDDRT